MCKGEISSLVPNVVGWLTRICHTITEKSKGVRDVSYKLKKAGHYRTISPSKINRKLEK